MKKVYFLIAIFLPLFTYAQNAPAEKAEESSQVDLGVGAGLDYGGFGGRMTYYPEKHVGLFGSLGYAVAGTGYNFGAKCRFNPDSRARVVAGAMYGYNAAIHVSNVSGYDKLYYGTSILVGTELRTKNKPRNYFSLELIIPFRPSAYTDALNSLKANPNVTKISEPPAVTASLGYHFGL